MTEKKIAASLNDIYEQDAYIIRNLPDKGVSEIIKAALTLYFEVQQGGFVTVDRGELDALRSQSPTIAAPAIDPAILQRQTEAFERQAAALEALAESGISSSSRRTTRGKLSRRNGNGHKPKPITDDREDPNDELVRRMAGMRFEEL